MSHIVYHTCTWKIFIEGEVQGYPDICMGNYKKNQARIKKNLGRHMNIYFRDRGCG